MNNFPNFIGPHGQDPEAKQTTAGQVVTFSLAETVFINGEKSTAWHDPS